MASDTSLGPRPIEEAGFDSKKRAISEMVGEPSYIDLCWCGPLLPLPSILTLVLSDRGRATFPYQRPCIGDHCTVEIVAWASNEEATTVLGARS